MQWRGVRRLSVRPSVCKLLRKSLLLAQKWPDRHQTCTRWSLGKRASRVRSRSRSRSKVTVVMWYAQFLDSWNELLRHWRSGYCVILSTTCFVSIVYRFVSCYCGSVSGHLVLLLLINSISFDLALLHYITLPYLRGGQVLAICLYTAALPTALALAQLLQPSLAFLL